MGNYMNKLLFHADESRKENEAQTMEQPQVAKEDNNFCTPTYPQEKFLIDPRSASSGIKRTPILVNSTPVGVSKRVPNAIPRHLQKKQYLETDLDVIMPPWSPKKNIMAKYIFPSLELDTVQNSSALNTNVPKTPKYLSAIEKERYKILGLDPRSPAADFSRTPILIPKSIAMMKVRSQDNLNRKGSYETDVYNSRSSWHEPSILLGNNANVEFLPDFASKRLKQLDSETRAELNIREIPESDTDSSVFVSEEDITVIKNTKSKITNDRSSLVTDEQTFTSIDKRGDNTSKQNDCEDVIEENMRTMQIKDDNKIKIWHDSMVPEENVPGKVEEKEIQEAEKMHKKEDIEGNVKKVPKIDVKFKSDEKKIFSPNNYDNEVLKNRTPLGNRSNNGKTQGIPTKSPQQLLKNKTAATKIQQENTPPYKSYNAKTRNGMQWDPNSSIII